MDFKPTSSFLKKTQGQSIEQIKLNPSFQSKLDKPLQLKSHSKRLESIEDNTSAIQVASQMEVKVKQLKTTAKKLNQDILKLLQPNKEEKVTIDAKMDVDIQVNDGYLKPSVIYEPPQPAVDFEIPTIFQTPPLPCFEQQKASYQQKEDPLQELTHFKYDSNGQLITENYSSLAKEGVWKIGKMKVSGDEMTVTIAGINMKGKLSRGQGKAVVINEGRMFDLGAWSGMWMVEPTDDLFNQSDI